MKSNTFSCKVAKKQLNMVPASKVIIADIAVNFEHPITWKPAFTKVFWLDFFIQGIKVYKKTIQMIQTN